MGNLPWNMQDLPTRGDENLFSSMSKLTNKGRWKSQQHAELTNKGRWNSPIKEDGNHSSMQYSPIKEDGTYQYRKMEISAACRTHQ